MAPSRIVFLMYHELELPGRKLVQSEPGYVRYILPIETFRSQMLPIADGGAIIKAPFHDFLPAAVCTSSVGGNDTPLAR